MLIVDRIENGLAVCEGDDDNIINIPLEQLGAQTHEGDVLMQDEFGAYFVDAEATRLRRERIQARFERLKRRNRARRD